MSDVRHRLKSLLSRFILTRRRVPISRCYHYRGFRYGGFGGNLYEDYVIGLSKGRPLAELRSTFASALLSCRPRTLAEALGITLRVQSAWQFPWNIAGEQLAVRDPRLNPDIVCHFCESGILASHINREFRWLESAFESIKTLGFRPTEFGYLKCLELKGEHDSSYLVLDGNHRISALHALGFTDVLVLVSPLAVRRSDVSTWPQVLGGTYTVDEALLVFDRYFRATNPPLTEMNPVSLIIDEPPLWS